MALQTDKLCMPWAHRIRRRFRTPALTIPLLIIYALAPACPAQNQPAQDGIDQIASALRDRDFTQALNLCQAALSRNPRDYRILTLRGMAAAGTGDLHGALTSYQSALKLSPNYLPALEGAAQTEFQLGDTGAAPLLQKVLTQRSDDETAHAFLAVIEYRKNDCSEAVVDFEKAMHAIAGQPGVLNDYGICLATLDRNDEAAQVFSQALELDSANPGARYNLALAQWNAHHGDVALQTLEPLIDASPAYDDALSLAADIFESGGNTGKAVELMRKALTANPRDVPVYLRFAVLSFDHASPQVGIDMINFGLTQMPDEPELFLARGILLTQLGEFARAADDFETASRIDPKLQFLDVAQGLVRSQQHNSTEALEKFRAAVRAHPNEAYAHYLLAEALLEEDKNASKDSAEELRAAVRATELDPHLVAAQDLLATIYMANGDSAEAIKHSRAALALDPNDQQAVYHLIVALRKTDEKDQVPLLLKRLIELRANDTQAGKTANRFRLSDSGSSPGLAAP